MLSERRGKCECVFVCVCERERKRERSACRNWINNRKTFLCLYPQHPHICIASCSVCVCVCVCVEKTVVLFCFSLFSYLADPRLSEPAGSLPNTSSVLCGTSTHTTFSGCKGWLFQGVGGKAYKVRPCCRVSVCLVVCVCV